MKVKDIFKKDIARDINWVIKVEDKDKQTLAQELDEYVLTDELESNYEKFFERYFESSQKSTQETGVWVSGFFGSGKSQMVKILGYVLEDKDIDGVKASERFLRKTDESLLEANVRNVTKKVSTKVLMFDIKSQEDQLQGTKNPITEIILRTFNKEFGYSEVPWVAFLERELENENKFEDFKESAESISGKKWENFRNNTLKVTSTVKKALVDIGIEESIEDAKEDTDDFKNRSFSPSDLVNYIHDKVKKSGHDKFVLIMDEIGQYIGEDGQKLLELQTIVENFGEQGEGDLWTIVTAQSALEEIISGVEQKKTQFKKISDRFETKINLTSRNIDKVVRERILQKTVEGMEQLEETYNKKSGSLKKTLSIESDRYLPELDQESFAITYPFLPYQLELIPKILTNIRTAGGLELASQHITGRERNLIKIVQKSIRNNLVDDPLGSLVTLDMIFDEIKSDLNDDVVRRIEDLKLESETELGKRVLKSLYLFQQLDWVPNSLDNILTAVKSDINNNNIEFREKLKPILKELEDKKYIDETTGGYRYLTPVEIDIVKEMNEIIVRKGNIRREVKEEVKQVMDLSKISYEGTTFSFNLYADGEQLKSGGEIDLEVVTPVDRVFSEDSIEKFENDSIKHENKIYWVAEPDKDLTDKIEEYLRLEKLLDSKNSNWEELSKQEISAIQRKSDDKNELANEIRDEIKNDFLNGTFIYNGNREDISGDTPQKAFKNFVPEVIGDIYNKFDIGNAKIYDKDIQDCLEKGKLPDVCKDLNLVRGNGKINENARPLQGLLDLLNQSTNNSATGQKLFNTFGKIPYGWDKNVVELLTAVALRANLIQIRYKEKNYLDYTEKELQKIIPNSRKFKECEIKKLESIDHETLHKAKRGIDEIWDVRVEETLPQVTNELKRRKEELIENTQNVKRTAKNIDLPIMDKIEKIEKTVNSKIKDEKGSDLIKAFVKNKESLEDVKNKLNELTKFVENDKNIEKFKEMKKFEERYLPKIEEQIDNKNELKTLLNSVSLIENWDTAKKDYNKAGDKYLEHYNEVHEKVNSEFREKKEEFRNDDVFDELEDEKSTELLENFDDYICDEELKSSGKNFKCSKCDKSISELENAKSRSKSVLENTIQEAIGSINKEGDEPKIYTFEISQLRSSIESKKELKDFIEELEEKLSSKLEEGVKVKLR